jgi:hypothetical protein
MGATSSKYKEGTKECVNHSKGCNALLGNPNQSYYHEKKCLFNTAMETKWKKAGKTVREKPPGPAEAVISGDPLRKEYDDQEEDQEIGRWTRSWQRDGTKTSSATKHL